MKRNGILTVIIVIALALSLLLVLPMLKNGEKSNKYGNTKNLSADYGKNDIKETVTPADVLGKGILACEEDVLQTAAEKIHTEKVSFIACGDNLIHSTVYSDAKTLAEGTDKRYNFIPMYDNVADIIKDADIAFINQESPFAGDIKPISGYPLFNSPDEVGYDLVELGFDVIGISNNHMLDSTTAGYKRTIEFWDNTDGAFQIGGYKNKEDFENIKVIEQNGIKIAFLSYTYGTNGLTLAKGSELYVPIYNDEDIDRQTKKARELADAVIVSIHWGTEDSFKPGSEQTRKAQIMIDNGVDVIIGHHPHVLQPITFIFSKSSLFL